MSRVAGNTEPAEASSETGEYEKFEGSAQPITPAEMMAEFHLLGHGEIGDDPESQEFCSDVDRLNSGWTPGDVPRVPDGYQSCVERSPALLDEERRALLLKASLAAFSAYWAAQGPQTAEGKRRKLEEEKLRRQLVASAKIATDAMPAGWLIEQIRSGESERLRAEGRRNYLMNRAKLARLRREGYAFDAQHRLVAPRTPAVSHRGEREQRPSATRRSSTRARSGSRGDPPPQGSDPSGGLSRPPAGDAGSRDILGRLVYAAEAIEDGDAGMAHAIALDAIDVIEGGHAGLIGRWSR
jgi:hypothetical protein